MNDQINRGRGTRVFHRCGKWPLVPDEDLLKLRHSLAQVQELAGPAAVGELLTAVDLELHRRGHPSVGDGSRPGKN